MLFLWNAAMETRSKSAKVPHEYANTDEVLLDAKKDFKTSVNEVLTILKKIE